MSKSDKKSQEMTIYERLTNAQNELKAPKNQYNNFGKYKYRSAEDILEAVKPINEKYGLNLYLCDYIEQIGERIYVKSVARLTDYSGNVIENWAYAREDESKKGMDGSQVTGASSSYARKYALNGLYLIDDTKDADTNEYYENIVRDTRKVAKKANEATRVGLSKEELINNLNQNVEPKKIMAFLQNNGYQTLNEISLEVLNTLWNNYLESIKQMQKQ